MNANIHDLYVLRQKTRDIVSMASSDAYYGYSNPKCSNRTGKAIAKALNVDCRPEHFRLFRHLYRVAYWSFKNFDELGNKKV